MALVFVKWSISFTWLLIGIVYASADTRTIDIRDDPTKPRDYVITFAAKRAAGSLIEGEVGHAFVIFNSADEQKRMTLNEVIGFMPASEGKDKMRVIMSNGHLETYEEYVKSEDRLIVIVDRHQYDMGRMQYERWNWGVQTYTLGLRDCVKFVREVAAGTGLKVPSNISTVFTYPTTFIQQLSTMNKSGHLKPADNIAIFGAKDAGPGPDTIKPIPVVEAPCGDPKKDRRPKCRPSRPLGEPVRQGLTPPGYPGSGAGIGISR